MQEKMPPKKKQRCISTQGQLWSKTEMFIQGMYTSGKTWRIEADKSCNDKNVARLNLTRRATVPWSQNTRTDSCDSSYDH